MSWPLCRIGTRDKIGYPSPAKARKYARQAKHKSGVTLYSYRCNRCGRYHLTKRRQPA